MCHFLRNCILYVRSRGKLNSSWAAVLLPCRKNWSNINGLETKCQQRVKKYWMFANNTLITQASDIFLASSCSSRQGASKHLNDYFARLGQHLTWDQCHMRSHFDPSMLCCMSVDASRQDKHNETRARSLAFFISELWAKTCRWPQVIADYLYEGHQPKFAPGSSTMV